MKRLIEYLIRRFLPDYHLHKNPYRGPKNIVTGVTVSSDEQGNVSVEHDKKRKDKTD